MHHPDVGIVILIILNLVVLTCYRLLENRKFGEEDVLWKVVRTMSGNEYFLAVEERALADLCSNPFCSNDISSNCASYKKSGLSMLKDARPIPPRNYTCCSEKCFQEVERVGVKLGTVDDAVKRFRNLLQAAREQKRRAEGLGWAGENASVTRKKQSEGFAAGSKKMPIMKATVQEKELSNVQCDSEAPKMVHDPHAVEGYVPKRSVQSSRTQGKRVQFADQLVQDPPENKVELHVKDQVERDDTSGAENLPGTVGAAMAPRLVFQMEDPKGPIDGQSSELGARFGTLKLETPKEDEEQNVQQQIESAHAELSVDENLTNTMRQGMSKYFPHLKNSLPAKFFEEDSELDETTSDDCDEVEGWMVSDDDFLSDEDEATIQCHRSFFGELFSYLDYWITDATVRMMQNHPSVHAANIPQVPEIMNAIQRLMNIATNSVVDHMKAASLRNEIHKSISNVIRTFRLDQSLPAFDSKQWRVVSAIILKALSLHSCPEYQKIVDTREGIRQLGILLGSASFTMEEFYAALELMLGESSDQVCTTE